MGDASTCMIPWHAHHPCTQGHHACSTGAVRPPACAHSMPPTACEPHAAGETSHAVISNGAWGGRADQSPPAANVPKGPRSQRPRASSAMKLPQLIPDDPPFHRNSVSFEAWMASQDEADEAGQADTNDDAGKAEVGPVPHATAAPSDEAMPDALQWPQVQLPLRPAPWPRVDVERMCMLPSWFRRIL